MTLISKKNLIPLLIEKGFIPNDKNVCYEAYGRKVEAYVDVKTMTQREKLEKLLDVMKIKHSKTYWPGHPVVAVQVTYFKAWHWDE